MSLVLFVIFMYAVQKRGGGIKNRNNYINTMIVDPELICRQM